MTRERLSLRAKALSLLAGREYSRMELKRKLLAYERKHLDPDSEEPQDGSDRSPPSTVEIDVLLDDFEARGWLSDARFLEQAASRLSQRYGPRRVVQTLREKGLSSESIAATMPYLKSQAFETAKSALNRKFSGPIATKQDRERRVRFLQSRGFDYDVIRKVLEGSDSDDH